MTAGKKDGHMHSTFTDEKCQACGEKFSEDSDIVVCPDCGAPYHRECYTNGGGCVYAEQHSPEFEWKSEKEKLKEHYINLENSKVEAEQAQKKELGAEEPDEEEKDVEYYRTKAFGATSYEEFNVAIEEVLRRQEAAFGEYDGVTGEEMCAYLGKNSLMYFDKFIQFAQRRRFIMFNFAAFLFAPVCCFFHRMNLPGVIITAILNITFLLRSAYRSLSAVYPSIFPESAARVVTALLTAAIIGVMIFCLMFFNYRYFKNSLKRIRAVKAECAALPREELLERLHEAGRPSLFNAIVFPLCVSLMITFVLCSIAMAIGIL